jgi:hypothetical protein
MNKIIIPILFIALFIVCNKSALSYSKQVEIEETNFQTRCIKGDCKNVVSKDKLDKIGTIIDSVGKMKYGINGSHLRKIESDGKYYCIWYYGPGLDSISCDSLANVCVKNGGDLIYFKGKGDSITRGVRGYWSGENPPCIPCGCNGSLFLDSNLIVLRQHYLLPFDSCSTSRHNTIKK